MCEEEEICPEKNVKSEGETWHGTWDFGVIIGKGLEQARATGPRRGVLDRFHARHP